MQNAAEGLDPTAEAEIAMNEVESTTSDDAAPARSSDLEAVRRALRELDAAKARVERDAQRAANELREKLVVELLPVLDNLDRTIQSLQAMGESAVTLQGVRLVRTQFATVLAKYGVERIDAKHQRFDPRRHDAISTVPVGQPGAHDVVVDQIEPGYKLGDRLLRPAKVVVGRYAPRWH
jgi:molecular chaperone GrpE (heat shock protein)